MSFVREPLNFFAFSSSTIVDFLPPSPVSLLDGFPSFPVGGESGFGYPRLTPAHQGMSRSGQASEQHSHKKPRVGNPGGGDRPGDQRLTGFLALSGTYSHTEQAS